MNLPTEKFIVIRQNICFNELAKKYLNAMIYYESTPLKFKNRHL